VIFAVFIEFLESFNFLIFFHKILWRKPIEVLAPMAGVTDGKFCRGMIKYGFDILTLGGYNAEKKSIEAGLKIIQRGRKEFHIEESDIVNHITKEAQSIKNNPLRDVKVSVNLRAITPNPVLKISKIPEIDIVEINAHCRQKELVESGFGQALLSDPEGLNNLVQDTVEGCLKDVSVKIRANVAGVNYLKVLKAIEDAGAHYLHVDAMKPGYNSADYDFIKWVKKNTNTFVIGNNSIKDVASAKKMLSSGADGISIARAAIHGDIPFDLSLI
jgi:TIM-barrel protein